jgi:hypothetical protein
MRTRRWRRRIRTRSVDPMTLIVSSPERTPSDTRGVLVPERQGQGLPVLQVDVAGLLPDHCQRGNSAPAGSPVRPRPPGFTSARRSVGRVVVTPTGENVYYRPLQPGHDVLPGGMRVHWQHDEWGCLECCIATMLGVERADVPARGVGDDTTPVEVQNSLEELHGWVRSRGLRMRYHDVGPGLWRRWWIGHSRGADHNDGHAVVCRGRTVVFDPALSCPVPEGCMVAPVERLDYAITFDRLEQQ